MTIDIFEYAARNKLRFPSPVGQLTAEQLWDLPLTTTKDGRGSLDGTARAISAELRSITEDSFVEVRPNPNKAPLETALEVVKHVIATKQAEAKAEQDKKDRAQKREKLLEALADRENEEIKSKSKEELLAELQALSA